MKKNTERVGKAEFLTGPPPPAGGAAPESFFSAFDLLVTSLPIASVLFLVSSAPPSNPFVRSFSSPLPIADVLDRAV